MVLDPFFHVRNTINAIFIKCWPQSVPKLYTPSRTQPLFSPYYKNVAKHKWVCNPDHMYM